MGITYDALLDNLRDWAMRQSVFFVASAPLRGRHINTSPKGLPKSSLAVLDPNQIAYVDSMGSGCETICHVRENGRVTILFCSFDKTPRILRLYCTGSVTESDRPEFHSWLQKMGDKELVGARAVIVLNIFKVQVSCGFGVPVLALDPGPTLDEPKPCLLTGTRLEEFARYAVDRGQTQEYQQKWNSKSLDGLPGLHTALRAGGHGTLWAECMNWYRRNQHVVELVQTGMIVMFAILAMQNRSSARDT